MDCRMSSELIMKHFDNEITAQEEKLLHEHLDGCESCRLEFEALKDTFSMLEQVELEEPPADIEQVVLSRIRKEDRKKAGLKAWKIGALVFFGILAGIAGLVYLFNFTQFAGVLVNNFNSLLIILNVSAAFIGKVLYTVFVSGAKLLTVGKALGIVERAIIETHIMLIITMVISMLVILKLYSYMFKLARR